MKVLLVIHAPLLPVSNGGQIDNLGMYDALSEFGFEVELIVTKKKYEKDKTSDATLKYHEVIRSYSTKNLLSLKPFQVSSRSQLRKITLNSKYKFLFICEQCLEILNNPHLEYDHAFIRRNNIESSYSLREIKHSSFLKKIFFLREFLLWKRLEDSYYKKLKNVTHLFVSEDEKKTIEFLNQDNLKYLPVLNNFSPDRKEIKFPLKLGFIGSLTTKENQLAANVLEQFAKNNQNYSITIGGSCDPKDQKKTTNTNIKYFYNFIDENEVWDRFNVFVISHSHSVGVKVKAIEAISRGKILVCCKEVLVGLPKELHNYCYIMDKEKQILDAIKEIENKGLKILNSKRNEANKILENISPKNKLKKILENYE